MTEAVIQLTKSQWQLLQEQLRSLQLLIRENAPSKEIIFLGSILAVLQILDGILTAQGVQLFGVAAEGNPLLRTLMLAFGHGTALIIAKGLSLGIILALCFLAAKVAWLVIAIRVVIFIYLGFAIIPWSVILLSHSYLS